MEVVTTYRDNGAIGALLDEYEKSIKELKVTISGLTAAQLVQVVDAETKDEDCRSIQTILSHVVSSGYTYAIEARKWLGEVVEYRETELLASIEAYLAALDGMFSYNVALFDDFPDIQMEEYKEQAKIKVRWGQTYDVEQLFEHAIVHILRHRRQIERFKLRL